MSSITTKTLAFARAAVIAALVATSTAACASSAIDKVPEVARSGHVERSETHHDPNGVEWIDSIVGNASILRDW